MYNETYTARKVRKDNHPENGRGAKVGRGGAPSGVRNDWVLNDNTSDRSVHEKGQMYKMHKKCRLLNRP